MTSGGSFLLAWALISSIVAAWPPRARRQHVVPALERGVGHHLGIAALDLGDDAHAVGVIGDDDPVQRLARAARAGHWWRPLLRRARTGWLPRAPASCPTCRHRPTSSVCTCSSPNSGARGSAGRHTASTRPLVEFRGIVRGGDVGVRTDDDFLLRVSCEGEANSRGEDDEPLISRCSPLRFCWLSLARMGPRPFG